MRFFDYIKIAFKNLIRQKARTALTIVAVVIGAVSVVIMLSIVIGARNLAVQQLESIGGFTLVSINGDPSESDGENLFNDSGTGSADTKKIDDTAIAGIKKVDHVKAVSPVGRIWANSMKLKGTDKKNKRMNVMAVDPDAGVFQLDIAAGRAIVGSDMDKIVIGGQSLKIFGFKNPQDALGQKVVFEMKGGTSDWEPDPPLPTINPDGSGDPKGGPQDQSRFIEAEIVGVLTAGLEDSQDYITIGWARRLMTQKMWEFDEAAQKQREEQRRQLEEQLRRGEISERQFKQTQQQLENQQELPNMGMKLRKYDMFAQQGYTMAMAKVDSTDNVKGVGEALKKAGWGVTTAQDMLDGISKIFLALGLLLGTIGGIALFVAAIGIINTMAMAIYERTREIGVMRACGATKATIRRLFTFEAALLGFLGGGIGLLISYGLAKIGNVVADKVATAENIPISGIISFPLWLILGTIAFTTFIGWLAGVVPAFRAARLDPVEALRYE